MQVGAGFAAGGVCVLHGLAHCISDFHATLPGEPPVLD